MTEIQATVSISNNLGGAIADILMGAMKGQNKAGERLLALSATEVPLGEDGTLMQSGQVVNAEEPGDATKVVYDTPYAARWHEDGPLVDSLGRHYDGNSNFRNGRKSHYLSDPALRNKTELRNIVAKEARSA